MYYLCLENKGVEQLHSYGAADLHLCFRKSSFLMTQLVCTLQMETTIKQAEEERSRCLDSVKHLYEDYRPMKEEVDGLRGKIGLDSLPNLQEDDTKLTPK